MKSLVILAILALPLSASAFIENRHLFPIGDSETMMANTGIALKGSSGNAFYNPAGLAHLKQRRLSLSGNTYMQSTVEFAPFLILEGQDVNVSMSGTQAVPSSVISTLPVKDWTFAFSVFVPEQARTSEISNLSTANFDTQFSRTVDQQLLLIGAAAGTTVAGIDAGGGCFLGMFNSSQTTALVMVPKPGSGITDPGYGTGYLNVTTKMWYCQGGVQKDLNQDTRVGAVVRLPSMPLDGQASLLNFAKPANNGAPTSTGIQRLPAKYEIPAELAFGVTHRLGQKATLLADLAYQLDGAFTLIEAQGNFETSGTLRWNVGGEYLLANSHVLRAGFASNPGAVKIIKDYDVREDYTVLTAGYEYREAQTTMGLGLYAASSRGEMQVSPARRGSASAKATAVLLTTGFLF